MAGSPEADIVFSCACRELAPETRERIETLVDDTLDWTELLRIARGNGVLPLLSHHLSSTDIDGVPDQVYRDLRSEYYANASSNLHRTHELLGILDQFEERGIPALPFKGPVLAQIAYDDLSLRTFTDLDILVARDSLPAAVDVLEERGFEWIRDAPRRDDTAVLGGPLTPPVCEEYKLRRERDDLLVELRWRLGNTKRPFHLDFESVWERRQTISLGGESIPVLDDGDRFLTLVYHGSKHYWERLSWITDIAALIQKRKLPRWPELSDRARRTRTTRKALVGAALAGVVADVSLPDQLAHQIEADERVEPLVAEVCQAFQREPVRDVSGTSQADKAYFFLRTCDSIADVVSVLFYTAPIHPECDDYEILPLPKYLFPVYYLMTPRRTVKKMPNVGWFLSRTVRSLVDRL